MSKTIQAVKPSVKNGNATKVNNQKSIEAYLTNGKKGIKVKSSNLPENVTGAKIEKVKRQISTLMVAKIEANKLHKSEIFGFNFNLNSFKTKGTKYLAEFNLKNGTKVTMAKVITLTPTNLTPLMSEKQREQKANNGNKWTFWDIETLVAKYFSPTKVVKVKKAK
jgi:hypothetical protein